VQLALAYPGTTPDYWLDADDRLLLTALDELDRRNSQARKAAGRGK
jgi:hypothetical protein